MNFTCPVPSLRHPDGGSRNGGSFGAQYARAEGNRNSRRMGADGGAFLLVEAAFGSDEEGCGSCMGGKCLGHGRATLFIREEEVAALGPILQKVLQLHHLAQFWQSGAPAVFGGFHQMAMQAEKIQLEIGRASTRGRVCQDGEVSVVVGY